jgi:ankyrin repeat protein
MASEHDRSAFLEPLPAKPNLQMQHKRAKNLLRAATAGDAEALHRIRVLHPKPPAPDALKLADAQLVVARGYGFESWPALRRKIDSLTKTPVEQFKSAVRSGDVDVVCALLEEHADVRAAVNAPIGAFGSRPVVMAKQHLPVIDVLLEHGADLNLKSDWWAGPFGILEYDITPEQAAPLIARGAAVDIFAAAHLDMADRVRELVETDPTLVFARGGDGKTALHCARSVGVARFLLERGAEIDARDVDHESTAAQYVVRESPDVARLLVDRGAWFDVFIAVGLRDPVMVERCLENDPDALDHRTGQGKYATVHKGRPSSREEIGDHRGDIYRWVFGHNFSVVDAARELGFDDMVRLLLARATPAQRVLAACAAADRETAEAAVKENPGIVAALTPEQMRLLPEKAYANDTAAVALMLDLGFDAQTPGPDDLEAIRWAVFHGNPEMTRLLLRHDPPIDVPDRTYGGRLLGNCIYGALHGWSCDSSPCDYVATVRLLIEAGEPVLVGYLPTGLDDVDGVLRSQK